MEFSESEWLANVQVWCMVGNKRHNTIKEETTKPILWIYNTRLFQHIQFNSIKQISFWM